MLMMNKYKGLLIVFLLLISGGFVSARTQARGLTLLVVPERYNIIQVSFDVISKRPVALVAYRLERSTSALVLHAWTGREWVPVSLADYRTGSFLIMEPSRIILVGDDEHLPEELVKASNWGPIPMSVNTMDPAEMLNALGPLFDFTSSEWRWFSSRYKMQLENVTERQERVSWYDQMTRARRRQTTPPPADIPPASVVPVPLVAAPARVMETSVVLDVVDSEEQAPVPVLQVDEAPLSPDPVLMPDVDASNDRRTIK